MRSPLILLRALIVAAVLLAAGSRVSTAQEFSETIRSVGEGYARGYVAPLMDAVGANFNAGLVPAVQLGSRDNRIRVYVGVKAFGAFIPESRKTFSTTFADVFRIDVDTGGETIRLDVPATFTIDGAPTVFGESEPGQMTVRVQHDTTISSLGLALPISIDRTDTVSGIGGIVDLGVAPFLVPELVLGTYLGTDLMLRWVPEISGENTESVRFFGLGIRHRLNPYLPHLPVHLAIQAVWQRAGADDREGDPIVRVSTFAANVQVGKRIGLLGVYAALQAEQSSAEIRYEYVRDPDDPRSEPISTRFTLSAANKMRGILGIDLQLGPVHATADLSIGRMNTLSAGLGLAF